ncbi:MAG TPA: phosphate ABC transporter permease PstA [Acidimicrobiales bacterium]|nr:phosphate ABC transporter permease PstA [Acidimicrobiales bacterium]
MTDVSPHDIEQFSPDDDVPRAPRTMLPDDWGMLAGSALAAVGLMWTLFLRLLPVHSSVGTWFLTWLVFLAIYGYVVRQVHGRLAAKDRIVAAALSSVALILFGLLLLIVGYVVVKGIGGITSAFFTQTLEKVGPLDPETKGGALHAILGTLMQLTMTVIISVPLGITTAVFLNEVGGRWARPVRTLVDAMSGVPSIVAGLFIYSALILSLGWGFSGFAASLALAVLMLPTVTRTTEVVLRLVPGGLREAALALGAPRWRVVLQVVLPTARSGVSTAVILGMARAVGETAPLILTALGTSIVNNNIFKGAQASLPLYIWGLIRSSDGGQQQRAWAGALALITLVLVLFTLARLLGRPRRRDGVEEHGTVTSLAGLDAAFDRFHLSGERASSMTYDTADHHHDRTRHDAAPDPDPEDRP